MPVVTGPRLKEEIGPILKVYCPKCKNLDNPSLYFSEKGRTCKKCGGENILLDLNGLRHPPGYVKRTKRRRMTGIGFMFFTIISTFVILAIIWVRMGILPFPETATEAEKQLASTILLTTIFIPFGILCVIDLLFMQFHAWKPEEDEFRIFLLQIIEDCLPKDVSSLQIIKDKKSSKSLEWMKNPIGLRYAPLGKMKKQTPITCPFCGEKILNNEKSCIKCGMELKEK